MPSTTALTDRLLALEHQAFRAATNHPWLEAAGQSRLSDSKILEWLLQDRLYALSYVNFIGSLLAKVGVPTAASREKTLEWRVCDMLIGALVNIKREISMFEGILRDHFGWAVHGDTDTPAVHATTAYQAIFAAASSANKSVLVGLTALWATEHCYLTAWRYARDRGLVAEHDNSGKTGVLQTTLIPNWTCDEFVAFVEQIETLVNEYAARPDCTPAVQANCESIWKQILWAEERFWPVLERSS